MGLCCCKSSGDEQNDTLIQGEINTDRQKDKAVKKLLLLGAGSSGKTTFFKQLKRIHGQGFTPKDRKDYQAQIDNQIIEQMQKLIIRGRELMEDFPGEYDELEIKGNNAQDSASYIEMLRRDNEINDEVARHIKVLWNNDGIISTWKCRAKLAIPDSCEYFFNNIDRISKHNYIPNDEDILYVRKRTTGIIEEHFTIKNTIFHIFDVGGQRNERKKWIHCFENVTAVIFVASLSCYDEALLEDEDVLVMNETLILFEEICNSRWFANTPFILFLNKRDLLAKKLKDGISLKVCFKDYKESKYNDDQQKYDNAYNFIKKKFEDRNHSDKKIVYVHETCATDKDSVEKVFNDVQHIVISASLHKGGLV